MSRISRSARRNRKRHETNCVVIQASGSMTASGLREAMFNVASSFAPCDIYAHDEGRILYCGHMATEHAYGQDTVLFPMTGSEDIDPTFHLIGFALDYQQVIFVDDSEAIIDVLKDCKEAAKKLRMVTKLAPIRGVLVRNFSGIALSRIQDYAGIAEKAGVELSFFTCESFGVYSRHTGHLETFYPYGFITLEE